MALTTNQRQAVRQIAGTAPGKPHARTLASLKRRGIANQDGTLTTHGERIHDEIMASGNGPEQLKALFRFG